MTEPQTTADFASLFGAMNKTEQAALAALPWTSAAQSGDAVYAQFSPELGFISITGAMPFIETRKLSAAQIPASDLWSATTSENLAQFLMVNPALRAAYLNTAKLARFSLAGEPAMAAITQISTVLSGVEAANFAIFTALTLAETSGKKTLLVDADPQNQYVFPMLPLTEIPKILTENLQKPSTFRADLGQCLVKLTKNLSYLNLHASSLRPFDETEFAAIIAHLETDFENIVVYSGKAVNSWLSQNAQINYAVCENSFVSERTALLRHKNGFHTVLIKKTRDKYMPSLSEEFSQKVPLEFWLEAGSLKGLKNFIQHLNAADQIVLGGKEALKRHLHCYTGIDLYVRYANKEDEDLETMVKSLQKKLRAYYPSTAFFSARSIYRHIGNLSPQSLTTILEIGDTPQLVSLVESDELRSAAIFPSGILPALQHDGVRIAAAGARALTRMKKISARGGFRNIFSAPRQPMHKPWALGAIMEQLQG